MLKLAEGRKLGVEKQLWSVVRFTCLPGLFCFESCLPECLRNSQTQALLLLSRWAVRRGWLCWLCWLLVKIEFKGFLGWIAKPQRQRASFSKAQSHLKSFRDNIDAILTKIFSIFRIFSKMPKIYEIIFRFTIHFSVIRNYFQYFSLRYWKIFLFNINIGAKIIRQK